MNLVDIERRLREDDELQQMLEILERLDLPDW